MEKCCLPVSDNQNQSFLSRSNTILNMKSQTEDCQSVTTSHYVLIPYLSKAIYGLDLEYVFGFPLKLFELSSNWLDVCVDYLTIMLEREL